MSRPAATADVPATLFEVSPTAGIPDAVLAPARLAAESAGYVAGWNNAQAEARRAADAERAARSHAEEAATARARAEVDRALLALDQAARTVEVRDLPSADEVERLILAAAFEIAEAVIGADLADNPHRGRVALARVLAGVSGTDPVVVRLSPADHAVVSTSELALDGSVTVLADPTLSPGDAYATTGATTIDARIAEGLARVRRHLLPGGRP
jgi:flagellar assembly protein FliH